MASVFPLEIYEIIVNYVPDDSITLTSLCLTSPSFIDYAQRRLYESFRTDRWKNATLDAKSFFETILQNHRLASYIHEFVTPYPTTDEDWLHKLIEALPLMINLKSFTIFTYSSTYLEAILRILVECPFRLEELRWNWVNRNPDQYHADLMTIFISQQTELRSLSLKMTPLSFRRDALPNLKSLATTCENITAILPYRPVETLDCIYLDADDPDFDNMTPDSPLVIPFKNIRRLCLGVGAMWFRNMEKFLPSLDVLQTSIAMVREYHLIASSFPHLRIVHITRAASMSEQGMMSKWLFSNLSKLEYVIWGPPFANRLPTAQPSYDCWARSSTPTVLSARKVHEQTGLLLIDRVEPSPSIYP